MKIPKCIFTLFFTPVLSGVNGRVILSMRNGNHEKRSITVKMQMKEEIQKLKKEKNAVILAHYYVAGEVQEIADYIGDSYYLSKMAAETNADRIIFCGVAFMGESAKILNPEKRVFMPDAMADCAMAHMAQKEKAAKLREEYADLAVVCYINSTAELKSCADVCVTSANAVKIVKKLPNNNIFFIPDGNLGDFVAKQVPEKNIIKNDGYCPVHADIKIAEVQKAKKEHPNAEFAAHPECTEEVLREADYVGSTSGIIQYVTDSACKEFIIGTEIGVFYELEKKNPNKQFYPVTSKQECLDMKRVTLEKIIDVLENESNEVFVSGDIYEASLHPLEKMLELAK